MLRPPTAGLVAAAVALCLEAIPVAAQQPPPPPAPAAPTPAPPAATTPPPATSAPPPAATAPAPTPAPPDQAAKPAPAPDPSAAQPGDAFGEEITMPEKTVVYFKGSGTWDSAFDTIVDAFKTVKAFLDKQGIAAAGPPMTIYTATSDTNFSFEAAVPVADSPKDPPKGDLAVGKSPTGKAFKFVHRGSYDSMDSTYEAITNFLDEKQLDAKDLFVEEYETDPVTTPEDKLVVDIFVPIK